MSLVAQIVAAADLSGEDIRCWEAIQQRCPELQSPFFSPHYVQAVAACRPEVRVARLGRLGRGGRTVGFFPFHYPSRLDRLIGAAERVGLEMTDYFGLIADRDLRIGPAELLDLCGLAAVNFTHLDESQLALGLPGESPTKGLVIDLAAGGAAYWENLKRDNLRFINDTNRQLRRIERTYGALRFSFQAAPFPDELNRLISYKRAQYLRTVGRDLFADPWRVRLLERLATLSEPGCRGVLSVLYAGEHWIASHFGLMGSHILHYWFPVYNPEFNNFSPGRLLQYHQVLAAQDEGVTSIDLGAGEAGYKKEFANAERLLYRGFWMGGSLRRHVARAAYAVRWRLGNRG